MRDLWPPAEPAQADYEALRAGVLAGIQLADPAAARFARGGLAALIVLPALADPVFVAMVLGAARPAWTPHHDPRLDALAAGFGLVLSSTDAESDDALTELGR